MKKKKGLSILLSILIVVISVWSTGMVAYAEGVIIIEPDNMLNIQVVNEDGNKVNNISLSLLNSTGVECAAWKSNNNYFSGEPEDVERNNSGIKVGNTLSEPRSTFEEIVAPANLSYVGKSYWIYGEDFKKILFKSGEEVDLTLGYMPIKETELTVEPNTLIVNANKKWKKACHDLCIIEGENEYVMNSKAGKLTSLTVPTECTLGIYGEYYGYTDFSYDMTFDKTTEYVKARMKLSEIDPIFEEDGSVNWWVGINNDKLVTLKIASGKAKPGEVYLHIISGAVINYPVPDSNGYVEFYVEKETGKFEYGCHLSWEADGYKSNGGGSYGEFYACEKLNERFKAIKIPSEGTTLNTVPAGEYTIKMSNVPSKYENPGTITVKVAESKDIQYLEIVLKKVHEHDYKTEYKKDANNHWKECACGEKNDVKPHTPGSEVTEEGVRFCAVCGYEIVPMLTIEQKKMELTSGETVQLKVTYSGEGTVLYKSSNSDCVSVSKNGVVTAKAPGSATITAYTEDGEKVTCVITVKETIPSKPDIVFIDVDENSWQYKYAKYVCENGYMKGKYTDEAGRIFFDPEGTLTRAEFVQVLYNAEGKPQVAYKDKFSDVPKNQWYTDAVMWATEKGIVSGYGNGIYGVSDPITREQLATMLYKYAQYKGYEVYATAELNAYTDMRKISDWATKYMKWIVGSGIMSGKGDRLDPQGKATRAECATLVNKFHIYYEK